MFARNRWSPEILDNSKPTVTWGRKAMGHVAVPHFGNMAARLPKESPP